MPTNSGFQPLGERKPKHAEINLSANGDLVAAVGDSAIRVVSMSIDSNNAGVVIFKSNDTNIGRITFKATDPPVVYGHNPDGWMQTAEGEKLFVNNASGLTLTGFLTYIEV